MKKHLKWMALMMVFIFAAGGAALARPEKKEHSGGHKRGRDRERRLSHGKSVEAVEKKKKSSRKSRHAREEEISRENGGEARDDGQSA